MAQTNYTPIILYNSGTTTNAPSASNLASGELAINYTDGKLFYKDNSSAIQVIGWKTTPTTAGGTGLTSYTAGDLPYYSSGTALSKLGIGTSGYVLQSNGSAPTWVAQSTLSVGTATNATNTAITDNTSSSATWYPTIVSATTGNLPQTTSSTKLSFVPSTGTLTATSYAGAWAGSTIGTGYGGTGVTAFGGTNTLLYTTTANTLSSITTANTSTLITNSSGAPSWTSGTTANRVLRTDGITVSFSQVALATDVSGVLPVANSLLYYNTNIKTISSGSNYDWYSIDFGVYTGHSARVEVVFSLISGGTGSRIWYRNSLVLETGGATLSENNLNAVNGANGTLSFVLSGATLTVRTTTSGTSETARMAILVEGYEMTSSRITVL